MHQIKCNIFTDDVIVWLQFIYDFNIINRIAMNTDRLHVLMQRYFSRKITDEEKEELALMLNSMQEKRLLQEEFMLLWNESASDEEPKLSENAKQQILSSIFAANHRNAALPKKRLHRIYMRVATVAASLLFLISLGAVFSYFSGEKRSSSVFIAKTIPVASTTPTSYTRNVILPDGSTVVLKAGSTLEYPPIFSGTTREVSLQGEAYFDIAPDKAKPFIIHTDEVKTTVLGTAFNIKAWPDQHKVTVSVTRGKVKVENKERILAVLTINEEVQYDLADATNVKKAAVDGDIVTDWTKQDMVFQNMTFSEIAKALSKRYGVNIEIRSKELAGTEMVSSFSGTESLDVVLTILCGIYPDTHFSINNKDVVISSLKSIN